MKEKQRRHELNSARVIGVREPSRKHVSCLMNPYLISLMKATLKQPHY